MILIVRGAPLANSDVIGTVVTDKTVVHVVKSAVRGQEPENKWAFL